MGNAVSVIITAVETAFFIVKSEVNKVLAICSASQVRVRPISDIMNGMGLYHLVRCMESAIHSKNENAIQNVAKQLSGHALDYIADAFKFAVGKDMLCAKCSQKLKNIDELCYCTGAPAKCHHICCCETPYRAMIGGF